MIPHLYTLRSITTVSLLPISATAQSYYIINCIPGAVCYIPVTYLFYHLKSVPLNPLHLFRLDSKYCKLCRLKVFVFIAIYKCNNHLRLWSIQGQAAERLRLLSATYCGTRSPLSPVYPAQFLHYQSATDTGCLNK